METTRKSINEQIEEVHKTWDEFYRESQDKSEAQLHCLKVIIQHVMKLEAKCYYMQKKLDEVLGNRPRPKTPF